MNAALMDCCVYIEDVKRDVFPPALAEIRTSLGERLPIFDEHTVREAEEVCRQHQPCYLRISTSIRDGAVCNYVRFVHRVDPHAKEERCYHCGRWAERVEGTPPYFRCPSCSAHTYTAPLQREVETPLPSMARATLTRNRDCLFALAHDEKRAYLTDCFYGQGVGSAPYLGVAASIEPIGDADLKLSELDGKDLLLQGFPFNGRIVYTISAIKAVVDMLDQYPTMGRHMAERDK